VRMGGRSGKTEGREKNGCRVRREVQAAGLTTQKQIPHPRSPKSGDRVRDDTRGHSRKEGGVQLRSCLPEEAELGATRAKCLSLVARVAWRPAAKQSA
jgi:hypothetical protein